MTNDTTASFHAPETATAVGWQGRLDDAGSADEVVAAVREFLARISPEESAALPADCRPRKIVDAEDVVDFAVTSVRRSCESESLSDGPLQLIASFLTDACARLSELGRSPPASRQ